NRRRRQSDVLEFRPRIAWLQPERFEGYWRRWALLLLLFRTAATDTAISPRGWATIKQELDLD
ncbi:MAG: hypothetical protein VYB08_15860, partial [Candidatus Latescibacterota bacterium]|nr:hypothetical protein [Candidatus Latescibacterota bacterium]